MLQRVKKGCVEITRAEYEERNNFDAKDIEKNHVSDNHIETKPASVTKPIAISNMTRAELDAELMKGVESIKTNKAYTADEVDAVLAKELGI